jgi:alpha-tubulin suppressor-like RCC1 family protein
VLADVWRPCCDVSRRHCAAAWGGRHHTVVVTDDGESWAWGLNSQGQLGIGSIKRKGTADGGRRWGGWRRVARH